MKVRERDFDHDEQDVIRTLEGLRTDSVRDATAAHVGKTRFLEQARAYQPTGVVRPPMQPKQISFWASLRKVSLALAFLIAIFVISGAGMVFAAQDSLPDQPLYAVKIASENFRLQLTQNSLSRLSLVLDLLDRRFDEMMATARAGKPVSAKVALRWEQHVQSALQLAAGLDGQQRNLVLAEIRARMEQQLQQLEQLGEGELSDAVLLRLQMRLREQIEKQDKVQPEPGSAPRQGLPGEAMPSDMKSSPGEGTPAQNSSPSNGGDGRDCNQTRDCPQQDGGEEGPVSGRTSTPAPGSENYPRMEKTPTPGSRNDPGTGESSCLGCTPTPASTDSGADGGGTSTPDPGPSGGSGSSGSGSGGGSKP